jgi:hypothetical protein
MLFESRNSGVRSEVGFEPTPQKWAAAKSHRKDGKPSKGKIPLGCSGRTALRREQCSKLSESRNTGVRSEVDFLDNT